VELARFDGQVRVAGAVRQGDRHGVQSVSEGAAGELARQLDGALPFSGRKAATNTRALTLSASWAALLITDPP